MTTVYSEWLLTFKYPPGAGFVQTTASTSAPSDTVANLEDGPGSTNRDLSLLTPTLVSLIEGDGFVRFLLRIDGVVDKWQYRRSAGNWVDILEASDFIDYTISGVPNGSVYTYDFRAVNSSSVSNRLSVDATAQIQTTNRFWTGQDYLLIGGSTYTSAGAVLQIEGVGSKFGATYNRPKINFSAVGPTIKHLFVQDPGQVDVEIGAVYWANDRWNLLNRKVSGVLADPVLIGNV